MKIDPKVADLLAEFDLKPIERHKYPQFGEIRALETCARILRRHGEPHLRLVLSTLAETSNNRSAIDEVSLWAVSDLIRAFPDIVENHTSAWLACFDAMPLGELMYLNERCLRGVVTLRGSLAGMVAERIYRRFGPLAAQPDLLDDRRKIA